METKLPSVQFILDTHDELNFKYTNQSHAIDFKPRLVNSEHELATALRASFLPLLKALVPIRKSTASDCPQCKWAT